MDLDDQGFVIHTSNTKYQVETGEVHKKTRPENAGRKCKYLRGIRSLIAMTSIIVHSLNYSLEGTIITSEHLNLLADGASED